MTLVFTFTVLTLGVVSFLLWPLLRRHPARRDHEQHDMTVYRAQLAEVDNDIERGLLTKAQAEAIRTEIHRRMLAVEDAELAAAASVRRKPVRESRKIAAVIMAITLPAAAAGLYLFMGTPSLPGKPFAEHLSNPHESALTESAEKMQAELLKKPGIDGYQRLANVFLMMRRYTDATGAYQKAIELGANDALIWSELGEAVALANDGAVVPEAMSAFYKALKLDRKDARARFYIGLAETQIGDFKKAVAIWKDLLRESKPDAPWSAMLKEHIESYAKEGGFDPASIKPAPPPKLKLGGGMLPGQ